MTCKATDFNVAGGYDTMKHCFRLAAGIILICALALPYAGAEQTPGPKAVFKETLFDYGEVQEGKTIEHTFVVANKGEAVLEIKDVKPG